MGLASLLNHLPPTPARPALSAVPDNLMIHYENVPQAARYTWEGRCSSIAPSLPALSSRGSCSCSSSHLLSHQLWVLAIKIFMHAHKRTMKIAGTHTHTQYTHPSNAHTHPIHTHTCETALSC